MILLLPFIATMLTSLSMSFLLGGSIVPTAEAAERSRVDAILESVEFCLEISMPNVPQDGIAMHAHSLGCLRRCEELRVVFPLRFS